MIRRFLSFRRRRHGDDTGASAVEYGLLVAGISAVIVGVVFTMGGLVKDKFSSTQDCISHGAPCSTPTPTPTPSST